VGDDHYSYQIQKAEDIFWQAEDMKLGYWLLGSWLGQGTWMQNKGWLKHKSWPSFLFIIKVYLWWLVNLKSFYVLFCFFNFKIDMFPDMGCEDLLSPTHCSSNHKKKKIKLRDILQNIWLGLLKMIKVKGNKERLRNHHRPEETRTPAD
jgi:hypothetical protein